jgi:hypothetical protein
MRDAISNDRDAKRRTWDYFSVLYYLLVALRVRALSPTGMFEGK